MTLLLFGSRGGGLLDGGVNEIGESHEEDRGNCDEQTGLGTELSGFRSFKFWSNDIFGQIYIGIEVLQAITVPSVVSLGRVASGIVISSSSVGSRTS